MHDAKTDGAPFTLSFDMSPSHVGAAQFAVMMLVRDCRVGLDLVEDVRLALDELLFAVRPGAEDARISMQVWPSPDDVAIRCELRSDVSDADLDVVRSLVDDVHHEVVDDHVVITFRRRFPM